MATAVDPCYDRGIAFLSKYWCLLELPDVVGKSLIIYQRIWCILVGDGIALVALFFIVESGRYNELK